MKSYPPPGETDGLTPEQAQAALNALHAACGADREHPYCYGNHVQHRDFVAYSTKLHTIIVAAEAEEKDAAAAQALEDARAEVGDLTPAECLDRGKALLANPGYLDGTMPQAERAKLKKQIDALYLVGSQPETSTPEEVDEYNPEETEDSDDLS